MSRNLPLPADLISQMPLSDSSKKFIQTSRETIKAILEGRDNRLLLIVGPCSLHDEESTYEYASRLVTLSKEVNERFFVVMRGYVEKPRTKMGWKGLVYDPDLDGSNNISKGLSVVRKILLNLTNMHIPIGCEILEFATSLYFSDFLSWGCIGARTSTSQPHRQLASSFSFPIGFKNSVDGNIDHALNGIVSAKSPHTYLGVDSYGKLAEITTQGNPDCHLVLRGGSSGTNYDPYSIAKAISQSNLLGINHKILVDCSHDNSNKNEMLQIQAFESVIHQSLNGNTSILGMMVESHLMGGSQPVRFPLRHGISITDPCLDWERTASLIYDSAKIQCQDCVCV